MGAIAIVATTKRSWPTQIMGHGLSTPPYLPRIHPFWDPEKLRYGAFLFGLILAIVGIGEQLVAQTFVAGVGNGTETGPSGAPVHHAVSYPEKAEANTPSDLAIWPPNLEELQLDDIHADSVAKALIQEGRPRAAIYILQSALQRTRDQEKETFSLRLLLAKADLYTGDNDDAAKILNALIAEKPGSVEAHLDLALAYARLKSFPTAVKQFREVLRLQPQNAAGLLGLSKALLNLKKSSEAAPYLNKYLQLRPNDAQGHYALGYALLSLGHSKEASSEFSQAARLSPDDYEVRLRWGIALWRTGQTEAAVSELKAAERLAPNEVQVHAQLARLLLSLGKKGQAQEESASAERLSSLKVRRDQALLCIAKGNLLLDRGDLDGAAEQFRQASELDPVNAGAHYNLGLALAKLKRAQEARSQFQEAIALDPKFVLAYNALGLSYKKAGQFIEAQTAFRQALHVDPQCAEAKNNLGTLYAVLGENSKAVDLFKEAIEDVPGYPMPYLNWGLLLANQGSLKEAQMMFEKVLQISPNLAEARKDLQIVNEALKGEGK